VTRISASSGPHLLSIRQQTSIECVQSIGPVTFCRRLEAHKHKMGPLVSPLIFPQPDTSMILSLIFPGRNDPRPRCVSSAEVRLSLVEMDQDMNATTAMRQTWMCCKIHPHIILTVVRIRMILGPSRLKNNLRPRAELNASWTRIIYGWKKSGEIMNIWLCERSREIPRVPSYVLWALPGSQKVTGPIDCTGTRSKVCSF